MKTKIKNRHYINIACFFIIMCLNIYKQSPRHIIKDTVMWYEKRFYNTVILQKVKFEYDRETGKYTGKFFNYKKNRLIGFIINGIVQGKRYCDSIDAQNEHSCDDDISELSEKY